jgi:leader peptidase (prepilin peptidase)/N-methyltransferase
VSPLARIVLVVALGGAAWGSFLGLAQYRVRLGQSLVWPPSSCDHCGQRLPPWLNVPVLAWPLLRGRCRTCRAPIPLRYWVLELWCAAQAAWVPAVGLHWALLFMLAMGWGVPWLVL